MYNYKHVILVGIDGAGNFYRSSKAPMIRRMMTEGAGTDRCLTSLPTISAECWVKQIREMLSINKEVRSTTMHKFDQGDFRSTTLS